MCFVVCVLSQSWGSWRVLCSGVILLRVWGAGQGRRDGRAGLGWAWVSASSPMWVPLPDAPGAPLLWGCAEPGLGLSLLHLRGRKTGQGLRGGSESPWCPAAEIPSICWAMGWILQHCRAPQSVQPSQLHCWGFSLPYPGALPAAVQGEGKTAFTESSLVSWGLGWVDLECFYGWGHSGTKPDIVFWVELINAQKIQTWVWLLCSKKQHNTVREYKKKLSSANIIYIGNGYSAPWNNFKKSGLKTAIPGNTIWLIPTKVLALNNFITNITCW